MEYRRQWNAALGRLEPSDLHFGPPKGLTVPVLSAT
jgi:hypothetical protein